MPRDPPPYEIVNNCVLPRGLYYNVEEDIWADEEDGIITIGWTDSSQSVTGSIKYLQYVIDEGDELEAGEPVATVEAAKWMGAVRVLFPGTVVGINDEAAGRAEEVHLINRSPYHRGWIARVEPLVPVDAALADFMPVDEAGTAYEEKMERHDLDPCIHCEEFEI